MDGPIAPDGTHLAIYTDTVEPCPCADTNIPTHTPYDACRRCNGSGYRLTKRIYRAKDLNLAACEALLKTKDAQLEKAANTLDQAAALFAKLGHPQESASTKAAAQALRESAQ